MNKISREAIVEWLKNLTKKEIISIIVVIAVLAAVISSFSGEAEASGYPPPAPPVVTTTEVTNFYGVDNNEFYSGIAATMAADAIHCTTSSQKNQVGIGAGYSEGHSGFAAGYCNSIQIKGKPVMLGFKASVATDISPTYSVGLNWTF